MRGSSSSGSSCVARRGSVVRPAAQPSSRSSRKRRLVAAAVRVAERPRSADVLDEVARALELVALRLLVEQAEPAVLPAVADHLVPAAHELAAAVERQVERVREGLVVVRDVLAEELVEQLLAPPVRQSLLERALHEHRRRRVVAVRRRVLRPELDRGRRRRRGSGARAPRDPASPRAGTACAARRAVDARRSRGRAGRRRRSGRAARAPARRRRGARRARRRT